MKAISEIKAEFEALTEKDYLSFAESYAGDERSGVAKFCAAARKKAEALEAEKRRIDALWAFERQYPDCRFICGIDEVGRGPFAGPVVAGACILPKDCDILYINDSKKLSEKMREKLYDDIREKAVAVSVGVISAARIDEINILQATYEAMRAAIVSLSVAPDLLLNDAVMIPEVSIPQVPIIKGDAKSISIGAASIYAKVTRDRMMKELGKQYPAYGFEKNAGYGTAEHISALREFGPCPEHRRSFIHDYI
ncbi:MAG: ribonuclease HII [Lachnospiraceae bacterium]|nr:ribonuclease HII [Lachnospiraceae bacterium]